MFVSVVSMLPMMSVGEGGGMAQVCALLSVMNNTERNISLTLATSDGTGRDIIITHSRALICWQSPQGYINVISTTSFARNIIHYFLFQQ